MPLLSKSAGKQGACPGNRANSPKPLLSAAIPGVSLFMKIEQVTKPVKEGFTEAYHNVQDEVTGKARYVVHSADEWVHDNPWKLIALVAVTSLILGVLLGNRGGSRED